MPLTSNDYKLIHTTVDTLTGKFFKNIWYFVKTAGTATAEDLVESFKDKLTSLIFDTLHIDTHNVGYEAMNLTVPTDFYQENDINVGQRTGDALPMYSAWKIRLNRPTRDVRNGLKSFGRISETDCINGAANPGGAVPITDALDALATAMGQDIFFFGSTGNYRCSIGGTIRTIIDNKQRWILDTLYPVTSCSYVRISTQNSRKNW